MAEDVNEHEFVGEGKRTHKMDRLGCTADLFQRVRLLKWRRTLTLARLKAENMTSDEGKEPSTETP